MVEGHGPMKALATAIVPTVQHENPEGTLEAHAWVTAGSASLRQNAPERSRRWECGAVATGVRHY